jgi:ankyrin repeat protein
MTARTPGFLVALATAGLAAIHVPAQDQDLTPGLVEAIRVGASSRVRQLLDQGVPAGSVSADGDTPLGSALRLGLMDLAAELLHQGADATACGPDGEPPLALASLHRAPTVMKMLLEAGANPNITLAPPVAAITPESVPDDNLRSFLKRERKLTPLMACALRGDVEAVSLLLKAGANREAKSSPRGFTALDLAAESGFIYVMRLLLGRDPDKEPQVSVNVSLSRQQATLQVEGATKIQTEISSGRNGFATPEGRYVVTQKYKEWTSTLYKVPMPFFMRLNCGNIGLHSGYVTGSPASHGCIRLPDAVARKFFDIITVGDEVIIER